MQQHAPSEWSRQLFADFSPAEVFADMVKTMLLALLLALLIRTFFVEVYLVFGPSMEPSLYEGERVLVNKLAYHVREPRTGEVVVFVEPGGRNRSLVKRVVGVSGQELEVRSGNVFVDGEIAREHYVISPSEDTMPPQTVDEGEIFVMGDNRSNSVDSRYFGPVSVDAIRGKAFLVFWPLSRFHLLGAVPRVSSFPPAARAQVISPGLVP